MWEDVVRECPKTWFFSYTKSLKLFNFSSIVERENFSLLPSWLPNGELNYGPWAWAHEKVAQYRAKGFNVKLCQYGHKEGLRCGVNCLWCYKHRNPFTDLVIFGEH